MLTSRCVVPEASANSNTVTFEEVWTLFHSAPEADRCRFLATASSCISRPASLFTSQRCACAKCFRVRQFAQRQGTTPLGNGLTETLHAAFKDQLRPGFWLDSISAHVRQAEEDGMTSRVCRWRCPGSKVLLYRLLLARLILDCIALSLRVSVLCAALPCPCARRDSLPPFACTCFYTRLFYARDEGNVFALLTGACPFRIPTKSYTCTLSIRLRKDDQGEMQDDVLEFPDFLRWRKGGEGAGPRGARAKQLVARAVSFTSVRQYVFHIGMCCWGLLNQKWHVSPPSWAHNN